MCEEQDKVVIELKLLWQPALATCHAKLRLWCLPEVMVNLQRVSCRHPKYSTAAHEALRIINAAERQLHQDSYC